MISMSIRRRLIDLRLVNQQKEDFIDIRYGSSKLGVPPNSVLFGGTVPPNSVLFGGTVPPNSYSQRKIRIKK